VSRLATICLLLLAALAGLAPPALAQPSTQDALRESEGKPIREIRFVGARVSSEAYLREQIRMKVGDPFSAEAYYADVKRLYETGRVTGDIRGGPEPVPGGVRVVFQVEELLPVMAVVYEGLSTYSERELIESPQGMRIQKPTEKEGFTRTTTYQEFRARADEKTIVEMLREKGKFFAECDSEALPVDGGVKVVFHVREGPTVRVQDIVFVGNDHIEGDELRKYMKTQTTVLYFIRSGYFNRDDLAEDMGRIETYYRGEGYLDARAFVDDLRFNADRDRVVVQIRVVEGDRYNVRRIVIRGTTLFTPETIALSLESKPGDPFSGRAIEKDLSAIQKLYMDRGYILTRVRFQHVLAGGEERAVDLVFTVEEGVKVTIEKVRFEGNVKTRDDVIRRDLTVFPGEPFSAEQMDESKGRLGRRGYYKDLKVSFDPGTAPDKRDLTVRVEEADTGQLQFGGGVSTSTGVFGRIVFIQRNFDITDVPTSIDDIADGKFFVGAGQTLIIQLEPGAQRSRYSISFVEPYLFPNEIPFPLQLRLGLSYYNSTIFTTYQEERLEPQIGLGYRITRDQLVELAYRFTRENIFHVTPDAPAEVIEAAGVSYVSAVSLAYRIDKNQVDQNFVRYAGWGADAMVELAGGPFGGDFDFVRVELSGNWQTTLFNWPRTSKHVIGIRADFGWMTEYGSSSDVPIFERFYAGGLHSVRGFRFQSVGPKSDDQPIGGKVRAVVNVEYTFPIVPGFDETYAPQWRGDFLRGALFCDAGNVEPDLRTFTMRDFRVAVGFGFRVKIPIFPAPVALNFGFPVKQLPNDQPEVFSFAIGTDF
jgi:outer membrane protein insertion porin family